MHLVNRLFLRLALLPAFFYSRIGVDTTQLKTILTTKLILDDRRPRPISQIRKQTGKKPVSLATLGTMLMSAVMGALFLFCFFIGQDIVTQVTLYFTFFFVFLSLTLITDFTSVLLDVRDNIILLPKPVSDTTIVIARLLHIFIHLCKIVLPMGLPGAGFLAYFHGFYAGSLLLLLIFFLAGFAIFFINTVYLVMLKFTTPQRFQAIITYVQILFAIVVYGSYQLLPRMLRNYAGNDFRIDDITGVGFYPPYWLANSFQVLFAVGGSSLQMLSGLAGLLFPLVSVMVVVKFLAPSFNRKLALLSASSSSEKSTSGPESGPPTSRAHFFSRLLTVGTVEKASFVFTWTMMSRSRDFKMKVYPAIGYLVVYAAYIVYSNTHLTLEDVREEVASGSRVLLLGLYLSQFLLSMAVNQVGYSDKYKASWIFYISPIETPGHFITGATKAVLAKFYFPVAAMISAIVLFIGGIQVVPNLLLALSNVVLITTLMMTAGPRPLPFSTSQSTNAKTGSFLSSLFVVFLAGMVGLAHYLIYDLMPVVIIGTGLSLVAVWYLFGSLRSTGWNKILLYEGEE